MCIIKISKAMSYNKSGRPTNNTIIKFSPQPASIISGLLKKIKADDFNLTTIDVDVEQCKEQADVAESEQTLHDDELVDNQQEDNYILCQDCSHRSSNMKDHQRHEKVHREKQFTCNYPNCGYTSKLSCNLIKHKRIHTSEKPYLCDQCSFRSNFVNSLKVHRRIHTDEKPYSCTHCSYRCNSSSNLKKHCRHRHWHIMPK